MQQHMFFERLFEKLSPSSGLLSPFDLDDIETVDTDTAYFEDTIYKKCIVKQYPLGYVHLIERAITRLCIPVMFPDYINFGGYGWDSNDNFYCDYYDGQQSVFNEMVGRGEVDFTDERHIIMKIDSSGKLSGTVLDKYGGETPYLMKTRAADDSNRHSTSAAIFATLAWIIAKHEKGAVTNCSTIMYKHYKDIIDGYSALDMPTFMKAIRALDADYYALFSHNNVVQKTLGSDVIDVSIYDKPDLDPIDLSAIGTLSDIKGSSKAFTGTVAQNASVSVKVRRGKPKTIADLCSDGSYSLGVVLSKEDESLIPKGFDAFIPSPITLDVAKEIKISSVDPVPCRNVLWTGETGTGKTTESQMLATLLHLPYRSMNLSSDKLSSDILVSCLPRTEKVDKDELLKLLKGFPDAETIAVNPEEAYKKITGEEKQGATELDVMYAKSTHILNLLSKAGDFMYVDSPFVETYRNGGVIELQECNSCKAAILKSLNEALDDLNVIHLPTGEIVHRNPNCVVVVTANVGQGYEGINNFSNDFIARFHQADVFELPEDKDLIERVKARSGYTDKKTIAKMIKVMHAIQRVLLETKGDYGSCSPRGLIAWARKTKNTGDVYTAGTKTIVGLATQDPEIRIEVLHALETEFAPSI